MFNIGSRRVKVVKCAKSQTVNVCTSAGIAGEYEYVVRIRPPYADEGQLSAMGFRSVDDLVAHLIANYGGDIEKSPEILRAAQEVDRGAGLLSACDLLASAKWTEWENSARAAVEDSIDELVMEFVSLPYLHRTEHSIHCRMYELLSNRAELKGHFPIGGRWSSQLIHKEWPEYRVRPDKRGRGNFDLAVLSPEVLEAATLNDFLDGRLCPSFVVEIGLDDKQNHLAGDIRKFRNSGIGGSYLVHLVRQDIADDFANVEQLLLGCGIRSAYARQAQSTVRYKLVNQEGFTEERHGCCTMGPTSDG